MKNSLTTLATVLLFANISPLFAQAEISDDQIERLAAIVTPPQLSERAPGLHTVPCLPGVPAARAGGVEGKDYYCGVFTTPMDYDNPDRGYLDLGFMVAKASGDVPLPDPLIYITGGPGPSGVFHEEMLKTFETYGLRAARDLVFLDTRGTGLSQRLHYDECLVLALQNQAPQDQIDTLLRIADRDVLSAAGIDVGQLPERSDADATAAVKAASVGLLPDQPTVNALCWQQVTGAGIDPNQFTTTVIARDNIELVKALGYDAFNVVAHSYGTRVGMVILDDIAGVPDAPELRSVILDGVYPPSTNLMREQVRRSHDFVLEVMGICQADPVCDGAYPNLTARFAALLDRLETGPLLAGDVAVTLDDVLFVMSGAGWRETNRSHYFPRMVAELEVGVPDTLLALRNLEVGRLAPGAMPEPAALPGMSDPVVALIVNGQSIVTGPRAPLFRTLVDAALADGGPGLEGLLELLALTYPDQADELTSLFNDLSAEDIANSPYAAQLPPSDFGSEQPEEGAEPATIPETERLARARSAAIPRDAQLLYRSIHCSEDIFLARFEDALNAFHDLRFPQLGVRELAFAKSHSTRCDNWEVDPVPLEQKNPVSSSVPTLILHGPHDFQTPPFMARRAERELDNARLVWMPQAGHGVWQYPDQDCAGKIAAAFIADPGADLDLRCRKAREPKWSLPGEALR
jgi:pimeloyl-ACP methyl ester carboxylesterase